MQDSLLLPSVISLVFSVLNLLCLLHPNGVKRNPMEVYLHTVIVTAIALVQWECLSIVIDLVHVGWWDSSEEE